jgi:predicted unusual protein kinase regulating ubiquinone biosynthesis (AarF/ABC1/UbiB family)
MRGREIEGFPAADPLERPLRISPATVMNLASVRERVERRRQRRRNTHRFRQIASVAVRYGLADQLRNMPGNRMQQWLRGSAGQSIVALSTPVRIRLALSELGTTFIKFGQMLSTRPDLVGQDVASELTHLQSRTPPDPPGVAEATIQKELGSPPATLFASFEAMPFASARSPKCTTPVCTAAKASSSRFRRTASTLVSKPT